MGKYVPYAKLSKKAKRSADSARRGSWGDVNPVTRSTPDIKIYNRAKARKRDMAFEPLSFGEPVLRTA